MAEYVVDDIFYNANTAIFNEQDVYTGNDKITELSESIGNELLNYVKKSGDIMSGTLVTPKIELTNATDQIKFSDATIQNTALTNALVTTINRTKTSTQYITSDASNNTTIAGSVTVNKIIFPDAEQNFSFSDSEKGKLTDITYDAGLLQTTVANNLYANNLTCGNINTSHLSGTTSNLQTQINTIVSVPAGTIMMWGGSSAPSGYLLCRGQVLKKTQYTALYNAIGDTFNYYKVTSNLDFCIPDLRGLFVRGVGENVVANGVTGLSLGNIQTDSVQSHTHKYSWANNTIQVQKSSGTPNTSSSVWDNSNDVGYTESTIYDTDNTTVLDNETRPFNISLNYIIKT